MTCGRACAMSRAEGGGPYQMLPGGATIRHYFSGDLGGQLSIQSNGDGRRTLSKLVRHALAKLSIERPADPNKT